MKHRKLIFRPCNAPLIVYEHPEPDTQYTVGVDTSGGVGLDYSVFSVLSNRMPFEQVAIWRSNKIRPAAAAEQLAELGWYYNNALMTVESNAIGAGLLDVLVHTHRYSRVYRKEEQLDTDPSVSDKLGYATTQTGKYLLLAEFQQAWRDKAIILHDRTTVEEFCNYVYLKKQNWNSNLILKTGAIAGMHDDCVIATMLALHAARLYPQSPRPKTAPGPKLSADQNQMRRMLDKHMKTVVTRCSKKTPVEVM